MQIIYKRLRELKPYEKNPRKNDDAVQYVAKSIEQFGFKVPMVIEHDGTIVCGHTRFKAAQELDMDEVPCIIADDLTDDQIRAFRLVDNKVGELATWDNERLQIELDEIAGIDMSGFGFAVGDVDIDQLFDGKEEKTAAPKMVTCPCCGKEFEKP